jgi:hypothetical protein
MLFRLPPVVGALYTYPVCTSGGALKHSGALGGRVTLGKPFEGVKQYVVGE